MFRGYVDYSGLEDLYIPNNAMILCIIHRRVVNFFFSFFDFCHCDFPSTYPRFSYSLSLIYRDRYVDVDMYIPSTRPPHTLSLLTIRTRFFLI